MITNSREKSLQAKLEGENINQTTLFKASTSSSSSSSRQWGGFRNPRIVRVSRSFGGKDRHSKVCTIRGLRDRRIRLSVPTAIQLYDLQDRLGLNQPSKVIDWLLDATKDDIDKLPPLQIPQGFGPQFHQQILLPQETMPPPHFQPSLAPFFDANSTNFMKEAAEHQTLSSSMKTKYWDIDAAVLKAKGKELFERGNHNSVSDHQKSDSIIRINEAENQDGIGSGTGFGGQLFGQKFFPMSSHPPLPGMLNNSMAYNYYHSEPSNLSLSHFGGHGFASQIDSHAGNVSSLSLSSPLPLASGPSQLFFCPPIPPPPPPLFSPYPTPYMTSTSSLVESDIPKQINHTQLLSTSTSSSHHLLPNSLMPSLHSSSWPSKSFHTISNTKQLHSHNNDESQTPEKGS
ncbi:hypothetical protein FEM48_Zijuj05G0124900 [Ziziphus jujuba var. spinosa]|uniref:TCP domain-containing protein n=1 Tax=Ziziphus jujuba var. spinosa TaxID=714518 RepID=A0A978VEU3_ZIZJJ|nr:hypothetical protein FEM48_Zijuj05G0124900 [Ziziphus jujuba var. spinosa]